MSAAIESLKEEARKYEQKEEWGRALSLYKRAIDKLEKDEQPDIGLYNRVGDLQVRQGQLQDAIANYERAIDLYSEADLPNNAIAVCKKIVESHGGRIWATSVKSGGSEFHITLPRPAGLTQTIN